MNKSVKWTPEPWRLEQNDRFDARGGYRLVSEKAYQDRKDQKSSARPDYVGIVLKLEDAAGIVSCVNALAGIPDPKEFVEAARDLLHAGLRIQCQCSLAEMESGHLIGCEIPGLSLSTARAEKAFGGK